MPKKTKKLELALSYSVRSKSLFRQAIRHYESFEYPLCIYFAQESMEFSIKSIMELHNIDYEYDHEISEDIIKLYKELPETSYKHIDAAMIISVQWLGKLRKCVRYGFQKQGTPPEKLAFFYKDNAAKALNDAEFLIKFLLDNELNKKTIKKIGILNGYVFGSAHNETRLNQSHLNTYNIDNYYDFFRNLQDNSVNIYDVEKINASKIGNIFDVIINPFSESYPEIHLNNLYVFYKIRNFIQNGGIFVNLGGLPFWAAQDVVNNKSRAIVNTRTFPIRGRINQGNNVVLEMAEIPLLETTLLWRYFNIQTTGDNFVTGDSGIKELKIYQNEKDKKIVGDLISISANKVIHEYRAIKKLDSHIIPLLRARRKGFGEIYPLTAIRYDFGYLFLASMSINTDSEFSRIVQAIHNFINWRSQNPTLL